MIDQLTSRFRFVCRRCGFQNECQQAHPRHLRPHLISTTCASCHAFNWLGGLKGTIVETAPPARARLRLAAVRGAGVIRPKAVPPQRH